MRNMSLYQAAFTDPSAVEPDRVIAQSFDRLEYLGDAVVQIVFAEYIYHRYCSLGKAAASAQKCMWLIKTHCG